MNIKQAIVTTIDDYLAEGYSVQEIGQVITGAHIDGKIDKPLYMFAIAYLIKHGK